MCPQNKKQAGEDNFPPICAWQVASAKAPPWGILFVMAKHFLKQGQPCKLTRGPRRLVAFYFSGLGDLHWQALRLAVWPAKSAWAVSG